MTIIVDSVYSEIDGVFPSSLKEHLSFFSPGYEYSPKYKGLCLANNKCSHLLCECTFYPTCTDKIIKYKNNKKVSLCKNTKSCKHQIRRCNARDECRQRKRQWDGRTYLLTKNKFPTGVLSKVEQFFNLNNIKYTIEDNRSFAKKDIYKLSEDFTAWKHQLKALKIGIEKRNGIFSVATSGGKTNIAAMITAEIGQPTIFLTHLKGLLHQTKERFENLLNCEVGIVGDGKFNVKPITVASIQTLIRHIEAEKDLEWLKQFKVMICDEVHHLSSNTWVGVCRHIEAPYRFGLSGTVDLSDNGMLLEAYTGPILYSINLDYLEKNKHISPFSVKIINIDKPIVYKKKYKDVYDAGIINNTYRNEQIINLAKLYYKKDKPTLILFRYIKHGILLCNMLKKLKLEHEFIYQNTKTEERIRIKNDIENGNCKILVASSVFDEGENLPSVSVLILAGGEKGGVSGRRLLQRIGRVLRLAEGKTEAIIFDFNDNIHKYLKDHSDQRLQVYKDNKIKWKVLE